MLIVKFDKRRPGGGVQGQSKAQAVKKALRTGTAVTEARRKSFMKGVGEIVSCNLSYWSLSLEKVGANKSAAFTGAKNMRKLDENTTDTKRTDFNDLIKTLDNNSILCVDETVSKSFSKALIQARMAKKMNQKALAQAINEKPTVINE